MFSTSSIIDNLNQEESIEYKKLCRLLKLTKKSDKLRLDIALSALEKLEIINKNDKDKYSYANESQHLVAKIRCSSKGYCFAIRDNNKDDIYIKENLLNHAWNGDKVLVRIIKEGVRRRSPEGIVDCILERTNQILLAKVEIIEGEVYGIPIDDRILAKIKLPKEDKIYKYNPEIKNIVKIEIDLFPIGQQEGTGNVIKELKLNNNEELDIDFVLAKSNITKKNSHTNKLVELKKQNRLDLTHNKTYMFKSWNLDGCPALPVFHIEKTKKENFNLWIHTNSIAERLDLSNKKNIDDFIYALESFPLLNTWQNYLGTQINNASKFDLGNENDAISLCIELNKDSEIIDWSFHLTKVKCSFIIENKHLEAISKKKGNTRLTSRILKPIKDHIEDIEKILEISGEFRKKQILNGRIEIPKSNISIESINELSIHNPADFSIEFSEPLSEKDTQTYLSPLLFEANLLWFIHANEYGLKNASYLPQDLDYINVTELIKNSELLENNIELNENGSLTFKQLIDLCSDEDKKRILHKLLINVFRDNEVSLICEKTKLKEYDKSSICPWTLPSYDFINLMNQFSIYNMLINGRRTNKNIKEIVNINEKDSWKNINWDIYNRTTNKNMDLLFNKFMIDKINEYKSKVKVYKLNLINIKHVRKAEKLIGNIYSGIITTVQSYGFFVDISELNVEGLVHVSTLNNDWYEYRSRQNLLIGRKSKNSYKIGDNINIKIIKVDILKYQIDLELV